MNPELHFAANVAALVFFGALLWWRLRRQPLTFADGVDGAVYLVVGLLVGAWLANALPRLADTLLGGGRYEPGWAVPPPHRRAEIEELMGTRRAWRAPGPEQGPVPGDGSGGDVVAGRR